MSTTQNPTPNLRVKFVLEGSPSDFMAGDEREYAVRRNGYEIGIVSPADLPSAREGGTPVSGWYFRHNDGGYGEGRTRQAAVNDWHAQRLAAQAEVQA